MLHGTKIALLGGKLNYYQKIKRMFGSGITEYWPLDEVSGTVARGVINGMNGVYSGDVTLAAADSPVEGKAPYFGGTNGKVNIYSAALVAAFNGAEGGFFFWSNILTAAITDSILHYCFALKSSAGNQITITKSNNAAGTIWAGYSAGGVSESPSIASVSDGWVLMGLTWSKTNDRVRLWLNGYQPYAESVGLGVWADPLAAATSTIGTYGANYWKGNISNAFLLNREATQEEIQLLTFSYASKKLLRLSILGDSISDQVTDWPYPTARQHNDGEVTIFNHAVAGNSIIASLATQVAAAANDNADIIIIHIGTNDDDAGDMGALQAVYEAGIIALKASNSRTTIYAMNVLKRWTNPGGLAEVDKGNIRTAVDAACTAQGITCWDTYTATWIDAADTTDGVHPDVAGIVKVSDEVIALL